MECTYFDERLCRSCSLMGMPYAQQLSEKQDAVAALLREHVPGEAWLPAATSPERSFRNKVKLAVGGTLAHPTLGLTDRGGHGVDLRECGIQERAIWRIVPDLAGFVTYLGLEPYDVAARRGALKFIHVTAAPDGRLMLRFVVREPHHVDAVRVALPALQRRLPQLAVASANLLPEHKAVVEGDVEIPLTAQRTLGMTFDDLTLHLQPGGFFQTNTSVATALYRQAATWADAIAPTSVLDLYCGVGGFALHLSAPGRRVHGVEIEPAAVEGARRSAATLVGTAEPDRPTFDVGDARDLQVPGHGAPDLVVVNPPRRGIGEALAAQLDTSDTAAVIYSSCNPESLARDLAHLPSFAVREARLFDMFAQTRHAEVAVLLSRR